MGLQTSAGSTLHVSETLPATNDVAGFTAGSVVYTKVGNVSDLGNIKQGFTGVEFPNVGTRLTETLKGIKTAVQFPMQIGRDIADAGLVILQAAFESDNNYTFKITRQDGTIHYFIARVLDLEEVFGDGNQVSSYGITFAMNSKPVDDSVGLFTLTYVAGSNGSIIGTKVQSVKSGGSGTAVYAAAANLYEFQKWNDDSVANPRTDTNVLANATYTATFVLSD